MNTKTLLLCALFSILSLSACATDVADVDGDLDEGTEEQLGEGTDALCLPVSMPAAQETRTVSGAGTYDEEYVVSPTASSYTVDFTMPAGKPGMYASAVWAQAMPATHSACVNANLTMKVWRRDADTGCWGLHTTKSVNGTWHSGPDTLFPCTFGLSIMDVSAGVPSDTSTLKVQATARIGGLLRRVGVRAGWSEPADVPR